MIKKLISITLILISYSIYGQIDSDSLHNLIQGDWYMLDSPELNQPTIPKNTDSSYIEVAILEKVIERQGFYIGEIFYVNDYFIKDSSIIYYTDSDTINIFIKIIDSNSITLYNKLFTWRLKRIDSKEYTLSQLNKFNRMISSYSNLPREMRTKVYWDIDFYYKCCLIRREILLRLKRNEINKSTIIEWIKNAYLNDSSISDFERRQFEEFIKEIDLVY